MAVDFSIQGIIEMIAQVLCAGNLTLAGLLVMMTVFFVCLVIMAMVHAPVAYSLVPLIPLAILFASMGVLDVTVSFFIILATAIFVAIEIRRTVSGD